MAHEGAGCGEMQASSSIFVEGPVASSRGNSCRCASGNQAALTGWYIHCSLPILPAGLDTAPPAAAVGIGCIVAQVPALNRFTAIQPSFSWGQIA